MDRVLAYISLALAAFLLMADGNWQFNAASALVFAVLSLDART